MFRKAASIICFIVSGFFLYSVCLLAFINDSQHGIKYIVLAGFAVPALIAFGVGMGLRRFEDSMRCAGIVLLSGCGFTLFLVFTIVCFQLSPEFKEFFPDETLDFFSDHVTGLGAAISGALIGVLMIIISQRRRSSRGAAPSDRAAPLHPHR